MFGNYGSKNFMFLLWFPFDPKNYYIPVWFFEMSLLLSTTWFDITMDNLNVLMMDLCATQFEILKNRLIHIGTNFTGDEARDDKLRLRKLRKYIIHHNYIYSCSELVRDTYSIGEFCQVGCSVMVVCFGLFKLLIIPLKSAQFLMLVTYSTTMIYQVSLYCCYGQKLLNASNTITEACYMSRWNDCSTQVQKYLAMIMNRANTPFLMKAGGIFSLTLETLMTIYTSAYSFFAILWKVYHSEDQAP
uniref:Odorant receptor n=1 Tax=Anoplophora chinensis TaxID=217632 RepID=A0A2H4ZB91_ANOCN|nr:odorant receptor [Anoplophora chinensis]